MKTSFARLLVALCVLALPGIAAACNVIGPNLSFGPYNPLSAFGATTSGTISVDCNLSPPPTVRVQIGRSAISGGFQPRRMRHTTGTDTLAYNLYTDAGGTSIWGDGTAGTTTLSDKVQKNKPWLPTVYGIMPPGQDVSVGSYTDTITISIFF